MVRTGATLADAAAEWLRFIEEDRGRKPSTLNDYRLALKAHLLPAFGSQSLESITPQEIDEWRRGSTGLSIEARKAVDPHGGASVGKTSQDVLRHLAHLQGFRVRDRRRLPSEAGGDRG